MKKNIIWHAKKKNGLNEEESNFFLYFDEKNVNKYK